MESETMATSAHRTPEHVAMETDDERATAAPPERAATWNFVQMNMSLLPIARPLPVATACHRFQESFQIGKKPRTPNQKQHRRVLQQASNISPRRHDLGGGTVRRMSNAGVLGATATEPPSSPLPAPLESHRIAQNQPLRIAVPNARFLQSTLSPVDVRASRERSQSETLVSEASRKRQLSDASCGYASDSSASVSLPSRMKPPLARSVSLSAASDARAYKGKRILELLDEERRLCPDERSAVAPSPTKRSRQQ